ncbi:MAG: AMP-binding protein [Coriobacteriales bacterium]|jgi:fatty-acyl-CoA synthase|nr:AMP-binding protein [Coriobacteriales bacterium]
MTENTFSSGATSDVAPKMIDASAFFDPSDYPLHTEMTLGDYFRSQVAVDPDHEFIVYPDRGLRWTYHDFDVRTDNLAKGLLSIGMRPGDHLGVWARNVPDWLTLMFATAKVGIVLVTMNPAYKSHELDYVLKQSDMSTLCIIDAWRDVDYVKIIRELIPEAKLYERGHLETAQYPYLKNLLFLGPEKHRGFYSAPELILLGSHLDDQLLEDIRVDLTNNDVINMQYTSGTTGFPKGVMLTHRNILNNGFFIGERQRLSAIDRVVIPVPLFHCFGCVLGVMAILTHRATLVMVEEFDALQVLQAIESEHATANYGVPTMFISVLNHPRFKEFDLSSLRTGIIAGAAVPPEVIREAMELMNMTEMTNCYGLTEASPVYIQTAWDDPLEYRINTVGRPHDAVSVRLIDPTTKELCGPGEVGELCVKGYNVMKGYYKMPEATKETIDSEGYLHSGDLGIYDENGYYIVTGRIKDMIIRGGENIYPLEIENFLLQVPGVLDAQVVGAPDDHYGEIVVAFVKTREGFELTETGIREAVIQKMARYKAPRYVFFVDEYPETLSKKVKKYLLRETAAELVEKRRAEEAEAEARKLEDQD